MFKNALKHLFVDESSNDKGDTSLYTESHTRDGRNADQTNDCSHAQDLAQKDAHDHVQIENQDDSPQRELAIQSTGPSSGHELTPNGESGTTIREETWLDILNIVNEFGWLTSRQILVCVFGSVEHGLSRIRRILRKMCREGFLLKRSLSPHGCSNFAYVLGEAGARHLRNEAGISAHSGKDLRFGKCQHRLLCNWHSILLQYHKPTGQTVDVWTEYEILAKRAPMRRFLNKIPDALVAKWDDEPDPEVPEIYYVNLTWIEYENSARKSEDLNKLIEFIKRVIQDREVLRTNFRNEGTVYERVL